MVNKKPDWLAYSGAAKFWNYEYLKIKSDGDQRVKDVKAALAAGYPVVFGTLWPKDFIGCNYHYDRSPEWEDESRKYVGGHAILAVGYRIDKDGFTWFNIRNSHGRDFGHDGHIELGEDWIKWENTRDITVLIGGK
jgi:C1A family cysteine protease